MAEPKKNAEAPSVEQPVPQTTVSLTMEQLQSIVNTAVQSAVSSTGDYAQLGEVIGNAVATGMARNAPKRKVTFGEYDPRTFVQPDKTKTLKLRRPCYQNGTNMDPHVLSNPEIDLLNRITHSGRYIDRKVEVIVASNGTDEEVYLRYNNRTKDQMLNNSRSWKSLEDMLRQIVTAQETEDKEAEDMKHAMAELKKRAQRVSA